MTNTIEDAKKYVESVTKQHVTLHAEAMGWYAFSNDAGAIAVVYWDVFTMSFKLGKPSKSMKQRLNIH